MCLVRWFCSQFGIGSTGSCSKTCRREYPPDVGLRFKLNGVQGTDHLFRRNGSVSVITLLAPAVWCRWRFSWGAGCAGDEIAGVTLSPFPPYCQTYQFQSTPMNCPLPPRSGRLRSTSSVFANMGHAGMDHEASRVEY